MEKENLVKLAQSFLKTHGYNPRPTGIDNSILFSRPTGMGITDDLLVYFHEKGEENHLSKRLKELDDKYGDVTTGKDGRRFFLSLDPLGSESAIAKRNGFKYQVPVWFFDREFSKVKKATPLKQLIESAARYEKERIAQLYKVKGKNKGQDLLEDLLKELDKPTHPCLRIILAPAGYGKSVLTETLYTRLNEKFLKAKQTQKNGKRPLLMLPGHVKQSNDLDNLISNFIGEEYDYGVTSKDAFKFMIKNNLAVWLLDGLEELILKIPEEFIYTLLEEYIIAGDAKLPQIIISIRKPVFANLPEFRESIEDYGGWIKIYELCDWEQEQKEAYFRKNLKVKGAKIESFMEDLLYSNSLKKLCSVPYYCKLIADLQNNNEMDTFNDSCDLVEHAFSKLCEREFSKGLDKDLLPVKFQREIFSDTELIGPVLRENKIPEEVLIEHGNLYLANVSNENEQIQCLQRHAILTHSGEDLNFMHDIIKQYLVGVCFLQSLAEKPYNLELFEYIEIEIDSFLIKYLVKNSSNIKWGNLKNKITEARYFPNGKIVSFCNILRVFLSTDFGEKELFVKDILQGTHLSRLTFKDLDMSGFEFQNSKLDSVRFEKCKLVGANFNGCNLKDILFDNNCDLSDATFKGAIIESLNDGSKIYYDKKTIDQFFYKKTKVALDSYEPCQAAINIKRIIDKVVRKGKGHKVPRKRLTNTKCGGGIDAYICVQALVKHKVLSEDGELIRIRVNLFDSIKEFALKPNSTTMPDILYKVSDDICINKGVGCKHFYTKV